jgi:hypothetical protein
MQSKSAAKGSRLSGCDSVIGIDAARILIDATLRIRQTLSKSEVRQLRGKRACDFSLGSLLELATFWAPAWAKKNLNFY